MRHVLVLMAVGAMAAAGPVLAQAPSERVIVTAPWLQDKVTPDAVAHDFIQKFAMPTVLRDAIPRWQEGICPQIEGLAPQYKAVVEQHLRDIAGKAAAPVKAAGCRPNLEVYFTPKPQAVLDSIHAMNADVLGYHGVSTVTHPIQAWYVTGIKDIRGAIVTDHDVTQASGFSCTNPTLSCWTLPITAIGGWRDHPDVGSDLLYVTIIVDSSKTAHFQVGEVADYIAMLALAETKDFEACQPIASIANLVSPDCPDGLKPAAITATDVAFLRGVYKMDPGATLKVQQDQIAGEMAPALSAGK